MISQGNRSCELVAEASTAAETLAIFQRSTPDLLLIDVDLPGKSGVALVADIKRVALGEVTYRRRVRGLGCRGNATDSLGDHSISGCAPVRKGRRSRGCADRWCGDRRHTKRARPGGFSFDEFGGAEQVDLSCVGRANGYGRGGRNRRCELRLRGEMVGGGRPCFRFSRDVQHPDSRRSWAA